MMPGITNTPEKVATQQSVASRTSVAGKDEFLKLLTYQLRSQNPLRPYDNQEFAAQLAQFSQLEQLTDIRSLLEEQLNINSALTHTIANTALPGMLGKYAKVTTNKFMLEADVKPEIGFFAPYSMQSGTMNITDKSGNIIKTVELTGEMLQRGEHSYSWDGTNNDGEEMPPGEYYFAVDLFDANGAGINADTYINGKIQAVRFKSEGTMLVINGMELSINNVTAISGGN